MMVVARVIMCVMCSLWLWKRVITRRQFNAQSALQWLKKKEDIHKLVTSPCA